MIFEIRHITQYQYDEPVRESVMELWMQPRTTATQRLLEFELDVDPHAQLFAYADSWGNRVNHFDLPHPHSQLNIAARSLVECAPPPPTPRTVESSEWEGLEQDVVRGDCWDFLSPHGFARETQALRDFCIGRGIPELTRKDPLTALGALNSLLYHGLEYEAGVTAADSPIDHALKAGQGVCQDFAHIMIAICRGWGVPARYVSGYLATDRAAGERSNPDATHAWVEVFLPSLRWIGFDPTNNVLASERHIAVAIGRDYADIPPSRGVFKGAAESQLSVGVSVRPAAAIHDEAEFLRLGAPAIAAARRRVASAALLDHHHQQQ